jgi:hypothetical protein
VKARIKSDDGKATEIILRDDGKTGDGAANDGVYGGLTEKVANGEYAIEAIAEMNGQTRVAAASLSVGATTPPRQPKQQMLKRLKSKFSNLM